MKRIWRCWPTLDVCIDIKAGTEETALEIMYDRIEKIRGAFIDELYDLGFREGGADFDYTTDSWEAKDQEPGDPEPIS